MQRRFFLFIIFFLITLVWMSSCKNNNEALEDMSNYNGNVFSSEQISSASTAPVYIIENSDTEDAPLIYSSEEINKIGSDESNSISTNCGNIPLEERWWYGVVDLDSADKKITNDNAVIHADWNSMAIVRYSTGNLILDYNYDNFMCKIEYNEPHSNLDHTNFINNCNFFVINENENYNGLYVEQAFFELMELDRYNISSVIYSGNITLKGIAKIEKENDAIDIIKRGDVFFYPYPECITDHMLLFPPYAYYNIYSMIVDEENNFYMYADTPQLYLGNVFNGDVYTRLREVGQEEPGWHTNKELAAFVAEEIAEGTYYELEIEISDIILNQYENIMTGSPFSAANVQKVISIEKIK